MNEPILQVAGLSKTFGAVRVLQDVSFSLRIGQVLGLAGHNGAGKSTLMNILSGVFPATTGTMTVNGVAFRPSDYASASQAGVFRIYQELSVIDNLTVAENLTLGSEKNLRRGGLLPPSAVNKEAREFLESVDLYDLDPKTLTGSLSMAQKQILEIVRSLYIARLRKIDTPVLLLDEPTSGLTSPQVDYLEGHIDRLRNQAAIVLTTHRGSELLEWSDDVIVLRDGQVVAHVSADELDAATLAAQMAGDDGNARHEARNNAATTIPVITIAGIITRKMSAPFGLTVHAGEIVGLISDTDDKSEIARVVVGADIPHSGSVEVEGVAIRGERQALRAGVRFVPADRGSEGLAPLQSVRSNLTVVAIAVEGHGALARFPTREKSFAQNLVSKFFIKVANMEMPAGVLSGGNQQKILVARSLSGDARAIVLDRPTRGIDVSAKDEIYRLILAAADNGVAFLIASDEPEEIMPICDRIVVLQNGGISREFDIRRDGIPSISELTTALV